LPYGWVGVGRKNGELLAGGRGGTAKSHNNMGGERRTFLEIGHSKLTHLKLDWSRGLIKNLGAWVGSEGGGGGG